MSENKSFRQIFGTETELPMSVRLSDRPADFSQLDITNYYNNFLIQYLPKGLKGTSGWFSSANLNFLSNGARYYNDVGGRFEYATPEDISIESVVLSELAGEWLAVEGLRRHIASKNHVREGFLSKRVDGQDETWGYHVNIGEDRQWLKDKETVPLVTRAILTHLTTSLPMLGGGAVYKNALGEYQYSWGQKVLNPISTDFEDSTTIKAGKPIVSLRDEPHANEREYWRFHLVGVDPHVSPWASKMLIGTVSLMLLAAREGRMDGMVLDAGDKNSSAARVMRVAAKDMNLDEYYQLEEDDQLYTALDIQEKLLERVGQTTGRTSEQSMILEEWQKAHGILKKDPNSLVKSDAILKRNLLLNDLEKRGKQEFDAVSRLKDMRYTSPLWATKEEAQRHTTDELIAMSHAGKIRAKYFADDMKQLGDLKDRIINPPKTTRAYKRGNEIRDRSAYWKSWHQYVTHKDSPSPREVLDPLEGAIETEYIKTDDILEG